MDPPLTGVLRLPMLNARELDDDSADPSGLEKGIAWFKLVFGCIFMAIGVGVLVKFFLVRKVFEIRARSPSLVIMSGLSLLGLLGLTVYLAAFLIFDSLPLNVYFTYMAFYLAAFTFSACFWSRVIRLGLAYCPRVKRKLPCLMSERLLLSFSLFVGLISLSIPLYGMRTTTGSPRWKAFDEEQAKQLFLCQVLLLIITLIMIPLVRRVDDLFQIRTELFVVALLQTIQTAGNALTAEYAGEAVGHWVNVENIPFIAAIIMFSLVVIDPLRRLAFDPLSEAQPALIRATHRRRTRGLRALKSPLSELTEPDSQRDSQDSGSAPESQNSTPSRRRWSYETIAADPRLAEAFRAFAFRALCQESVLFLEDITRYQNGEYSMCAPNDRSQKAAFSAMVSKYIVDGSADEVNISGADKKAILEINRNDAEKFDILDYDQRRTIFGEAYVEVRYMLETNLLQRFMDTEEFKQEAVRGPPARARRRRGHLASVSDGGVENGGLDDVKGAIASIGEVSVSELGETTDLGRADQEEAHAPPL